MGHFPNKPNLFSSFSGFMTRMFYDAVDNFIESNEYCWADVFPDVKMESTNAKEETINLDRWQPFKTLTCRPINASLTGNTRCENFLCVDDLVSGIEEALSKERMDKLFGKLGTDLRTRRKVGAKEIYLATRWSVHDPIGRLQRLYEGNPRCRFVAIPDIDPTTGRSNFEYDYGVGFTVKYFTDIAATMDEISYRCMFKSEPIEREGILYNADQLKRYLNLPMDEEGNVLKPDAIFSVCDTKDTGKDYNAHVCIKQYGNKYYLDDVVFKNIDPGTLDYLNADMIVRNKVQMSQFESNKEGSRTANEVERIVTEKGWFCHFTKKYTTQNKETKIIINSPWVLEHVYFKDPSLYPLQSDYANFIKFLCSWTQLGKNTHDDAPDVMAMVAIFVAEMLGGQVEVMSREELGF
jgi:predicted phage terminase large subunit-like protein